MWRMRAPAFSCDAMLFACRPINSTVCVFCFFIAIHIKIENPTAFMAASATISVVIFFSLVILNITKKGTGKITNNKNR